MQRLFHFTAAAIVWRTVLAVLVFHGAASAATLQDFGYQHMHVNGKLAVGQRPLLLIVVNFAGETPLAHTTNYYADLVFNQSRYPSLNGYLAAMSNGRFSWTLAGVVQLNLATSEQDATWPGPPGAHDYPYSSNIVYKAMLATNQFNFKAYGTVDATGVHHITQDELGIVVIGNDLTGMRPTDGTVTAPDRSYTWGEGDHNVGMDKDTDTAFIVMCEEFEETLGCLDIYGDGCFNTTLSSQACYLNGCNADCLYLYYLDPWNRMSLGWCSPRIKSLATGGVVTISAAQAGDPTSPVILYDPLHGTNEYWILEYRTQTSPWGGGYDTNVALNANATGETNGLAVWHIQQNSNHSLITTINNSITGGAHQADWNEGPPNLKWGASTLWGSDSVTPRLTWLNGDPTALNSTQTATHLHVRPFALGDGSITVEWLTDGDVWVDFAWTGVENGTFSFPYNTLAKGINALPYGENNHIYIKTGTSSETMTISKPMTIISVNGPSTIGH
jgi:hypothetical protein